MFKNFLKIIFFLIMMLGTMISISANSWLSAWIGLEINLLAFIPLMSDNKLMSTESSLKYFLTQALASLMLLFATIFFLMKMDFYLMKMMIFLSLIMKSGSSPFHFWLPNVMEGLSWSNVMILMTWQKIAPLMLISYAIIEWLIIFSIILSSLVGAMGGLNQTSLRKLMAYSSINHIGWMLMSMNNSNMLWMNYFLFYSLLTFGMIFMLNLFNISYINQLFSFFFFSKILKFFFFFNMLSLGGLPPFLGFFPKWMVIQLLIINNQLFLLFWLLMTTLITLYFYIRLTYSAFMLNYYEINWFYKTQYKMKNFYSFLLISFFSSFGLFLSFSLYLMF